MGTISVENSNRLFWLGRYIERVFTTLKSIEACYDKMIDESPDYYKTYLAAFGLKDSWGDSRSFLNSFLYDTGNMNSVAYSLKCAYDNGIVLREGISTEALAYIQLALDTLEGVKGSERALRFELLKLEDYLYAFWGCIEDNLYDEERLNIIRIGKSIERLDLYFRLKMSVESINMEFERLCDYLRKVKKGSPYRYNTAQLSVLVEVVGMEDYSSRVNQAIASLGKLFEVT